MFIQICLWGPLFAYPSDCSGLLLVTVKKAGCVARPSVSNAPLPGIASHLQWWVTWALGLFPGPLPALSFLFRTPTPVKYTEQFVWDETLESYVQFLFLLQLSLRRLRVISHSALLCCAALTLTPGVLLGWAVMSLLLSVEWLSFLWMQFQTLISLTTVAEILLVICICWFQGWSISGIAFNFVIFSCMNFFCFFLSFFFFFLPVMVSSVHLYSPVQPQLLSDFEKFLKTPGSLKSSFLVSQGCGRLLCLPTSVFLLPLGGAMWQSYGQ